MDLSMKWLADYVDCDMPIKDFVSALTLSGSKVECFEQEGKDISNVVVGKVVSMERHPDSDHMFITQVDVGEDEPVQIVTGAQNVHEGDFVPVAKHKSSVLHEGKQVKITKGKLRGVASNGMLCSLGELGLSVHDFPYAIEDGIFILGDDCDKTVGKDIHEAIGYNDTTVEFEITSNRPDCLSVIGLARETAATFGTELKVKKPEFKGIDGDINDMLKVKIHNTDLCKRYMAGIVKNVKIGPSPRWMRERLRGCGVRPINNFVDITNYVMLEYGRPMHAFDLRYVKDASINIRNAKAGETITTLDGEVRELSEEMLVIADAEKPIAVAGVMGGEYSGIMDDTTTVVFESACFDGASVRTTAKKLGMRTDASARYEKGLDPHECYEALMRAFQLVEELGAGEVVGGMVDVCSETREPSRVKFEPEKINKLLGTSLTKEEMIDYLGRVELAYDEKTDEIVAPTFRQDIHCNADVAEEVARFYGYDKIPMTLPTGEATTGKLPFKLRIQEVARDIAEYCGFSEGMSYSFESPKVFDKLCIPEDSDLRKVITISNPLGEDYSIMRTSTLNGMLASLSTNYNRRNKDVRLYELGNIYLPKSLPVTELPDERTMFTLGMYGKGDFFDMKGVCEEFFEKIGMKKKVTYDPNSGKPFLHPGRQANMIYEGKVVGYLGEVHPAVADNYSIGEKAYIAVIDILDVLEFAGFNHKYTGIAKYPAVTRDLSLVVPHAVLAGQIEEIFDQRGGNILESYQLFDIYEGAQIEKGFKSMAYSLVFRAHDKTLGENEISAAMKKIMNGLNGLGIELRS